MQKGRRSLEQSEEVLRGSPLSGMEAALVGGLVITGAHAIVLIWLDCSRLACHPLMQDAGPKC